MMTPGTMMVAGARVMAPGMMATGKMIAAGTGMLIVVMQIMPHSNNLLQAVGVRKHHRSMIDSSDCISDP